MRILIPTDFSNPVRLDNPKRTQSVQQKNFHELCSTTKQELSPRYSYVERCDPLVEA